MIWDLLFSLDHLSEPSAYFRWSWLCLQIEAKYFGYTWAEEAHPSIRSTILQSIHHPFFHPSINQSIIFHPLSLSTSSIIHPSIPLSIHHFLSLPPSICLAMISLPPSIHHLSSLPLSIDLSIIHPSICQSSFIIPSPSIPLYLHLSIPPSIHHLSSLPPSIYLASINSSVNPSFIVPPSINLSIIIHPSLRQSIIHHPSFPPPIDLSSIRSIHPFAINHSSSLPLYIWLYIIHPSIIPPSFHLLHQILLDLGLTAINLKLKVKAGHWTSHQGHVTSAVTTRWASSLRRLAKEEAAVGGKPLQWRRTCCRVGLSSESK